MSKKLPLLTLVLFILNFVLHTAFANSTIDNNTNLISFEDLCKYDNNCWLLQKNGKIKEPHRLMILLFKGFKNQLIQLGKEYDLPAALPAAVIITEHSLNVGIEESLQDALANTVYTREGSFLGLKSISLGFGQIKENVAWLAEQEVARREKREPDKNYMRQQLNDISGSLKYAAALIHIYAKKYKDEGFEKYSDVGVLSTLYNIGKVEQRIQRTKEQRREPGINYFGWFVTKHWAVYESILSEDTLINNTSLATQDSIQANNQDYSGVEGAIRWTLNYVYSTPVLARLKTEKTLRLFYAPTRCSNPNRDNFVYQNNNSSSFTNKIQVSFKTTAVGYFQLMAVSFDCNGDPWAMLDFDDGISGWINFKDLETNLNYKYSEVQCENTLVKSCMGEVKSFIQSNEAFKNHIGKNVILHEDEKLGRMDIQLAPGPNKEFVNISDLRFSRKCEKRMGESNSKAPNRILNDLEHNADPAIAFKLRFRLDPSKNQNDFLKKFDEFETYLQFRLSDYRNAVFLDSNIKAKLEILKAKILKDTLFKSATSQNLSEIKILLKRLTRSNLYSWFAWLPIYEEHCSQEQRCFIQGLESISELSSALDTNSIWGLFSRGFKIMKHIQIITEKRLYENWQKERAEIFGTTPIENDIEFINTYCNEAFVLDPQIKKDFEHIVNETIYSQKSNILYSAFKLKDYNLQKLANACSVFSYMFKHKSEPQHEKIQIPFTNLEQMRSNITGIEPNPLEDVSIHLNELDSTVSFPYEVLPSLPMDDSQIKSIITIALNTIKERFENEVTEGQGFLQRNYPNLADKTSDRFLRKTSQNECAYNPEETFLRIQALSKLDCVQNIGSSRLMVEC